MKIKKFLRRNPIRKSGARKPRKHVVRKKQGLSKAKKASTLCISPRNVTKHPPAYLTLQKRSVNIRSRSVEIRVVKPYEMISPSLPVSIPFLISCAMRLPVERSGWM